MRSLTLVAALFLSSCATLYQEPTTGPLVSVQFVDHGLLVLAYVVPEGRECDMTSARWGMIKNQPGKGREARISAASPTLFHFNYSSGSVGVDFGPVYYCNFQFRLTPKIGSRYVVDHTIGGNVCHLTIEEVNEVGVRVPVRYEPVSHAHCPGGKGIGGLN
jgi:hypothetical protein